MADDFKYDVFLSHSAKDKAVVRDVAERLRKDGLRVWFDEWEIRPGDSIPAKIEAGLENSRVLMLCMSAQAFGSDWAQLESHTFRFRDPLNKHRRFISLRLDEAPVKGSLAQFLYINWLPANREQEYPKLLEACRPTAKPPVLTNDRGAFVVEGGRPLNGSIVVRGAKNTTPKQLVAALLTPEPCILRNVAQIRDVVLVSEMIRSVGGQVEMISDGVLKIRTDGLCPSNVKHLRQFAQQSRIPILLCAPLLHRLGIATIPRLGGCELNGKKGRPVDFHIVALSEMGAAIKQNHDESIEASCTRLIGGSIRLSFPSVGATEQVLLAAVLARGTTYLSNASLEPEVIDLICVLQQMGAIIHWDKSRDITIQGVPNLSGFDHTAMADRSEIGSWACAAAATNGSITVQNAVPDGIEPLLDKFEEMGGQADIKEKSITFGRSGDRLRSIEIETGPHPQFRTDWQPSFVTALTQADGESLIHETVFADRLGYTVNLKRMGAQIEIRDHCVGSPCRYAESRANHSAIVRGPTKLKPIDLAIADLRGGFACLLAALVAEGKSVVRNASWLHKGYESIETKLGILGAVISPLETTESGNHQAE